MSKRSLVVALRSWVGGGCIAGSALAQVPAAPPAAEPVEAPASALPAPPAPPPQAPAAARTTAPSPIPTTAPQFVVPPGYKLVREDEARDRDDAPPRKPIELPYEEGDPVPPGYVVRDRPRRGLTIAGSIVTGVPWFFSVTAATAANFEHKSGFLVVPGLGPWMMLLAGGASDNDCANADLPDHCSVSRAGLRAILVFDGLVQSAGAAMLITGLALPRKRLVPTSIDVSIAPVQLSADGYGVGAFGTF